MDTRTTHRRIGDGGVGSVQFVLAAALSLIFFIAMANLVVVQYGRGAIRSALDQGARAGALTGSAQICQSAAGDVLGQLLGGRMGQTVSISCSRSAGLMTARASAVFQSWTPLSPDFAVSVSGEAAIEPETGPSP